MIWTWIFVCCLLSGVFFVFVFAQRHLLNTGHTILTSHPCKYPPPLNFYDLHSATFFTGFSQAIGVHQRLVKETKPHTNVSCRGGLVKPPTIRRGITSGMLACRCCGNAKELSVSSNHRIFKSSHFKPYKLQERGCAPCCSQRREKSYE